MGPGHLGIGFAAKPVAPKAPLWVLLLASEAIDFLCIGFAALGIEKLSVTQMNFEKGLQTIIPGSVPWSHGLLMALVWSVVFALISYLFYRDRMVGVVVGLVVFSHWVLDFITYPPDLPIFLHNSPKLGLSLWTSGPGIILSLILELALLSAGIAIYIAFRKKLKRENQ